MRYRHSLGLCFTLGLLTACQPSEPLKPGWLEPRHYRQTASIRLQAVPRDASGLAYDPQLDALWLVHDDPASLVLLDTQGKKLGRWPLNGINDPEAVALIEITETNQRRLVISDERTGRIIQLRVDPDDPGSTPAMGPVLAQIDKRDNKGIEGLDYRPVDHSLWMASEHYPQAMMHLSRDGHFEERWRSWPWRWPWDYSGLAYVAATDSLLVLSERSSVLLEYDLQGRQLGRLRLPEIKNAEGVALATDGRLFICAEPYWLYVFQPGEP